MAVQFLYRCTTGLIDEKANGCIMADEMGLGKTVCDQVPPVDFTTNGSSFNVSHSCGRY